MTAHVEALIQQARSSSGDSRSKAIYELSKARPVSQLAVATLTALLGDADQSVRVHAAQAIANLGQDGVGAVSALTIAIADPDFVVSDFAGVSLGHLANLIPEAEEALLAVLAGHEKIKPRHSAAQALRHVKHPSARVVSALVGALSDPAGWVRATAAGTLGLRGSTSPEVLDALATALQDQDSNGTLRNLVREEAERALAALRAPLREVAARSAEH